MLQRFYGDSINGWLDAEIGYINKYIKKLSRLRAEESMQRINEIAIGSGVMEKKERRKMLNVLSNAINGPKRARKKLSKEQQAFMLAQMGIKLEC